MTQTRFFGYEWCCRIVVYSVSHYDDYKNYVHDKNSIEKLVAGYIQDSLSLLDEKNDAIKK